jgi:ubiquinone/menaquinone biosynthesis C-methylase UbiE
MHEPLNHCLCCNNSNLFTILDLNSQPPANSFHNLNEFIPDYELKLMGCDKCWHTQLSVAVDPEELFKNYLYVSGTSNTLKQYFDRFAVRYTDKPGKVLDIACNDGTQLDSFAELGWDTYGVDPAENLYHSSTSKGHCVSCNFWNTQTAKNMPVFDLITAQNVFAHTSKISEFLEACKMVMNDQSLLVIQTSQALMFDRNEFDTIYHEHISFFSTMSMKTIAERNGLYLNNVYTTDIHGTSYVFELSKVSNEQPTVKSQLETEQHRYNRDFYETYQKNAMSCLQVLKDYLKTQRNSGVRVIGYGAAAKGMTIINAGKLEFDYIVDDNPLKQGLLCPGSDIPIYGSDQLVTEKDSIIVVPLAWNFFDEIESKVRQLRPEYTDTYVKYFPELVTKLNFQ